MSKVRVLVAHVQEPELQMLLREAPPEVEIRRQPPGEPIGDHIGEVEVLYGTIREPDFARANALRWVQQGFVGVEGHMYPAFQESDVVLTNCRGLYGPQLAEHAFALLLALTRAIPAQLRFMKEKQWERVPCIEVSGMTMGILGLGGIGRAVAQRAKAFDFRVLAVDPEPMKKPDTVEELGTLDRLPEMLSRSNVLVCCCPITAQTHKLLSHEQFNRMPDGSYFVNVSRGRVVDEEALVAALRSGKLAAAGLDVTYTEPCPPESPLWTEPNVILTSHSAGMSQNIRARALSLFLDNLHRYVKGEPLLNLVDKQKGY
jgi:phosphoglycerate dehydrogenase-like enzyme